MQGELSFFSDPKVILSLLAIIVSIVSLIWTLSNQWEQNRRWEEVNNANVEVKEMGFVRWKQMPKEEALSTDWGYNPVIYDNGDGAQTFLPYRLIARDQNGKQIDNINPVFTVNDLNKEINRLIKIGDLPANFSNASIHKLFRTRFVIENLGKTTAKNVEASVFSKFSSQDWTNTNLQSPKLTLSAGQQSTISINLELPLNVDLPSDISFKILLKFQDVNNNSKQKEVIGKWDTYNNLWSYGSD